MGLISGLLHLIIKLAIYFPVLGIAIIVIPGIPPNYVEFESFRVPPTRKLEGELSPNSILNNAQVLKLDKEIDGPESVSICGDELYFGDKSGAILKAKKGRVSTVVKLEFPCWHTDRKVCSYPLATRFDPKSGKLVFTDIYGGLLQVNVDTGSVEKLHARGEYIEGRPVGFLEDVDVAKDGTIYWSDGMTSGTIETMINELLGGPSGRLLKYEPTKNKSTVLLNRIHFANGVQLSPNEDFILVAETMTSQIKRYYLKGEKKGQSDIFIEGLPGYPDNIRSNNNAGFYVSLYAPRMEIYLDEKPMLRRLIARIIFLLDYITATLYNIFPTDFTIMLNKMVTSATELNVPEPRNGFVVELNGKGDIIRSLQSTNGALYGISQISLGDKYVYFASPGNTKIWFMNTHEIL